MAELNKIRFFLVLSFMVCASQAIEMLLAEAEKTSVHTTLIRVDKGKYIRSLQPHKIIVGNDVTKVVVYICKNFPFSVIMYMKNAGARRGIAEVFSQKNQKLLILGVKNPKPGDLKGIISEFIVDTIERRSGQRIEIEVLGDDDYHQEYRSSIETYRTYTEDPEGTLRARLNSLGKQI